MGADLEFFARVALRRPVALHPAITGIYYAACAGSAIHTNRWKSQYPPVVRLLRSAAAASRSAREYADWILLEHALTGICAGDRRSALAMLRSLPARSVWWMRAAPPLVVRLLVRLRRSRAAVRHLGGPHRITNRVIYSQTAIIDSLREKTLADARGSDRSRDRKGAIPESHAISRSEA
jgi:hypothetical protein